MARYLSPDWFEELNAAARSTTAVRDVAASATVTLQQVVSGGPDGDVRYWLRVHRGAVSAGLGEAVDADATVTQSWPTAVAIVSGQLGSASAFLSGRVRLAGDIATLVEHQAALQALESVFAEVRSRTSYD